MTRQLIIVALLVSLFFTKSFSEAGGRSEFDSLPPLPILKQLELVGENGARVVVSNHTNVMLEKKDSVTLKGYRIKIFFDNSQSARSKAEEIQISFSEKYPTTATYLEYVAPHFNVMVGDFIGYQEALLFLNSVVKDYPKSFIVPQEIPVRIFGVKREVIVPDSTQIIDSTQIEE